MQIKVIFEIFEKKGRKEKTKTLNTISAFNLKCSDLFAKKKERMETLKKEVFFYFVHFEGNFAIYYTAVILNGLKVEN